MQAAIGEKLLISMADYFVMSRYSGFARQPAVQVRPQQLPRPGVSASVLLSSSLATLVGRHGGGRPCSLFIMAPMSATAAPPLQTQSARSLCTLRACKHPPGL